MLTPSQRIRVLFAWTPCNCPTRCHWSHDALLPICPSKKASISIMESLLVSLSETMPLFSSLPKPFSAPILRTPHPPLLPQRRSLLVAAVQMNSKEAKLWGGRFEESVTDAVERFTESISFDKALYKHDIMGSRAHASMLAHQVRCTVSIDCFFFFCVRCNCSASLTVEGLHCRD